MLTYIEYEHRSWFKNIKTIIIFEESIHQFYFFLLQFYLPLYIVIIKSQMAWISQSF